MLPNPWLILVAIFVLSGTAGYSYHLGGEHRQNAIESQVAREEKLIQRAHDATLDVAGDLLGKLKVQNVTTKQILEREIRVVPDYSRCLHSPDGLRIVNDALENRATAQPSDSVGVSNASPPDR